MYFGIVVFFLIGRCIYVYVYGFLGVMLLLLCKFMKGLIMSIVYGNDIVLYFFFGFFYDF